MSTVTRHVNVRGRVQGVGYRAWTEDEALARGLEGWVRNRREGGPDDLALCRRGERFSVLPTV